MHYASMSLLKMNYSNKNGRANKTLAFHANELYGKQLFTWLVVSLMASSVLSFFPLDVLDEIWDLIESVSEGFLTYSFIYIFIRMREPDS